MESFSVEKFSKEGRGLSYYILSAFKMKLVLSRDPVFSDKRLRLFKDFVEKKEIEIRIVMCQLFAVSGVHNYLMTCMRTLPHAHLIVASCIDNMSIRFIFYSMTNNLCILQTGF